MSWNGYLYRLKSREEDMFKIQEELDREVREAFERFERAAAPSLAREAAGRDEDVRRRVVRQSSEGEILQ